MQSRRDFLKLSAATPLLTGGVPLLNALSSMNTMAASGDDYRALVCVFLFGGMDCHDTVLPYDVASYNSYAQIRSSLLQSYAALPGGSTRGRETLLPLQPAAAQFGGRQFALPPEMSALHGLFEQGKAAIVGNVGPLLQPTDRALFQSNPWQLPDRLFSHNDQQSTWMSFATEGSQLGWGGRFGDFAAGVGANLNNIFSQISLAGNTVFLSGDSVGPYQVNSSGVPSVALLEQPENVIPQSLADILRDHFTSAGANRSNLLQRDFIDLSQVSFDANELLSAALESAPGFTTEFPASPLGAQLAAVARTIEVRTTLGASRQVFFVAAGGFDTHSAQASTLPALQQDISESMAAFYATTEEMGIASEVTTFTMADFGRTLTTNGDGTDHGWGGHHFVVGGAVNGGDIYGDIPVAELGHAQDAGNGRLIPSVAVEQLAAALGGWYGLNGDEVAAALPGLGAFPDGALPLFQ
ncbi:DUF1501 domain-containing protein [Halieaceae bacterium IMCC14734]|uniref:DUF1501 domain-containing protein n=1 Tax=Candidatus Litorirhabdus singularis TaxID=2518993 RepID=A0ABT3TGF7_9GAMM|nr:DUF1501 domain-containing protein [Candidatus Litorirhabdus singularis]MCX2980504.1 DUF1501 domain-containing protein [Candidatus Litorirhabdus singularis]